MIGMPGYPYGRPGWERDEDEIRQEVQRKSEEKPVENKPIYSKEFGIIVGIIGILCLIITLLASRWLGNYIHTGWCTLISSGDNIYSVGCFWLISMAISFMLIMAGFLLTIMSMDSKKKT